MRAGISKNRRASLTKEIFNIYVERGAGPVDRRALRRVFAAARGVFVSVPRRISLAIVGAASMAALHEKFAGVAGTTDVLAFPLGDSGEYDGEVVVCAALARREAARRKIAPQRELNLYLAHGLLHLAGFDDRAPRARRAMRAAERRVLAAAGRPAPAQ